MKPILKIAFLLLLTVLVMPAGTAAQTMPPADVQIAAAILAAPEERQADATVLGLDRQGELVTLRKGSNDLVCITDDPRDDSFSVACYHEDLEPFMARGRELTAQGITGVERNVEYRWKEVEEGTLPMSRQPRMLYVLTGEAYDAVSGTVTDPYLRWVLYWPFATAETTGLSTRRKPGEPWLMDAGTAGAHVMISPLRQ